MTDDLPDFLGRRGPVSGRPLNGLTILVVEDSRFASEAIRLLCLRSGARIRRADCLRSARRHLQVYRPTAVIVDLGLPDGSGAELIADLAAAPTRVPAILATSGDPAMATAAAGLGADGFLEKPVENVAVFQRIVLTALSRRAAADLRLVAEDDVVLPDPLALRDDLNHVADVLGAGPDDDRIDYLTQFLAGLARSARDPALEQAASDLAVARRTGHGTRNRLGALSHLVQDRLRAQAPF